MLAFPGHEQQVWLHDVGVGQVHVAGRHEHSPCPVLCDELSQVVVQVSQYVLVLQIRGGNHDQVTVEQLVALVLRCGEVVRVGELDDGLRGGHVGAPVPPVIARIIIARLGTRGTQGCAGAPVNLTPIAGLEPHLHRRQGNARLSRCARCARRCSNATAKDGRHDLDDDGDGSQKPSVSSDRFMPAAFFRRSISFR